MSPFVRTILLLVGLTSLIVACGGGSGSDTDPATSADTNQAAANSNQMCGNGETFLVNLPGVRMAKDPSTEGLTNRTLRYDSITLPKGCRIYAILVHGYGRNADLDELMYYKLAKYVAENDGYVHWSWWNNFLGEYMERPLHAIGDPDLKPSPGNVIRNATAFLAPKGAGKAVPDDDHQFQADAKRVLAKIKEVNPDAIIIVAGHSMGGNAVARLGRETKVDIDLLAPIDPVGNRNNPVGVGGAVAYDTGVRDAAPGESNYTPGNETFNWTRWRATRKFKGFKKIDCIRNSIGLCKNFESRLFRRPRYRCTTVGDWLEKPPIIKSKTLKCKRDWPYYDKGTLTTFGPNIKRLYHRWQKEAIFPYDFQANYYFGHWAKRSMKILGRNYQAPVTENSFSEGDRDKTCSSKLNFDPRGARSFSGTRLNCEDWDGHGEIIGMRALTGVGKLPTNGNLLALALTAQNPGESRSSPPWLEIGQSNERRARLIEMKSEKPWPYAPVNPDLDLVVDDMVKIVENILTVGEPVGEDVTPPTSSASLSVEPNTFGWNNTDVVVTLSAYDEQGGSGVKEIEYTIFGAETGNGIHAGNSIEITLVAEGTTTIEYFARDNEGNQEEINTLVVNIDKTYPTIEATANPEANEHGWNNTDVTVSFTAEDLLSGIDTVSDAIVVTTEGANQEIIGVATDRAGNMAATGVILNIDKTPPVIVGLPENCSLWSPNHKMVKVADVLVTDELSGVDTQSIDGVSSEPESGSGYGNKAPDIIITDGAIELRSERYSLQGRTYDLAASAVDLAGNTAEGTASCVVLHDQSK